MEALDSISIQYQLVPTNVYRRNASERAIHTFKNHFIAGIVSLPTQFPLYLWCRLLPQDVITFNLIRQYTLHPHLSAHAHLYGTFNYNATPMAPPGSPILIHNKPSTRKSWAPHGVEGFYIGPALHHYRCNSQLN